MLNPPLAHTKSPRGTLTFDTRTQRSMHTVDARETLQAFAFVRPAIR
jgi:hypothetical protein